MKKVLIVSHDAGGAEILSAWSERHRHEVELHFCLEGPAKKIFERALDNVVIEEIEMINALNKHDLVLTGTSLESNLERRCIDRARRQGVPSASFMDHWDLYPERFGNPENWRKQLPDEIWVGDEYAYAYAIEKGFPQEKLKLVENPYFNKIKDEAEQALRVQPTLGERVLYICEPIHLKLEATFGARAQEYDDEYVVIRNFLEALSDVASSVETVTLRLHPSESPGKYQEILNEVDADLPVVISDEERLIKDVVKHTVVVGMESMGLVVGVLLGKRVFSVITGKTWQISLPHAEIQRYNDFAHLVGQLVPIKGM